MQNGIEEYRAQSLIPVHSHDNTKIPHLKIVERMFVVIKYMHYIFYWTD